MPKKLLSPEQVRQGLARRYDNHHRSWLEGGGEWPLRIALGTPTETDVADDPAGVRAWIDAWRAGALAGEVETADRRWPRLGVQTLPAAVVVAGAADVAAWCGQEQRWARAHARFQRCVSRWPGLRERAGLGRFFDVLADYGELDFERLVVALDWLLAHPASGLYVRQLPLEGVDTKWVEKRTGLLAQMLALLGNDAGSGAADFFQAAGLSRLPHRVRIRILCPQLRRTVGGLRDVQAPVDELARLDLRPGRLLVVENQETGAALPDMPSVVAILRLGNSVGTLGALGWAHGIPAVYWGDIDTHGLAILSRARAVLPAIRSVLMDVATLLRFKALTVVETQQHAEAELAQLTAEERALFDGLKAGTWGARLRLEQERVPWPAALLALGEAMSA